MLLLLLLLGPGWPERAAGQSSGGGTEQVDEREQAAKQAKYWQKYVEGIRWRCVARQPPERTCTIPARAAV